MPNAKGLSPFRARTNALKGLKNIAHGIAMWIERHQYRFDVNQKFIKNTSQTISYQWIRIMPVVGIVTDPHFPPGSCVLA